ncbi:MAG: hypothetical protein ACOYNI_05100 [Acidimicrobiia bacterium]
MAMTASELESQAQTALAAGDYSAAASLGARAVQAFIAENPDLAPGGRVDRRIAQLRTTVIAPALDATGDATGAAEQRQRAAGVLQFEATTPEIPAVAPPTITSAPSEATSTSTTIDLTTDDPEFAEFAAFTPAPAPSWQPAPLPQRENRDAGAPSFSDAAITRLAESGIAALEELRNQALTHDPPLLADVGVMQRQIGLKLFNRGQPKPALAQLEQLETQFPFLASAPEMDPAWEIFVTLGEVLGVEPDARVDLARKLAERGRDELALQAWVNALSPIRAKELGHGVRAAIDEPSDKVTDGLMFLAKRHEWKALAQYFEGREHDQRSRLVHHEADRAAKAMVEALARAVDKKRDEVQRGEHPGTDAPTHAITANALVFYAQRAQDPDLRQKLFTQAIERNHEDPKYAFKLGAALNEEARRIADSQPQLARRYLAAATDLGEHAPEQVEAARTQLEALNGPTTNAWHTGTTRQHQAGRSIAHSNDPAADHLPRHREHSESSHTL